MRDPNRINNFCEELAKEWHKCPDMRFGQFISNVISEIYTSTKKDIFYLEDEEMFDAIKNISWLKNKN